MHLHRAAFVILMACWGYEKGQAAEIHKAEVAHSLKIQVCLTTEHDYASYCAAE